MRLRVRSSQHPRLLFASHEQLAHCAACLTPSNQTPERQITYNLYNSIILPQVAFEKGPPQIGTPLFISACHYCILSAPRTATKRGHGDTFRHSTLPHVLSEPLIRSSSPNCALLRIADADVAFLGILMCARHSPPTMNTCNAYLNFMPIG